MIKTGTGDHCWWQAAGDKEVQQLCELAAQLKISKRYFLWARDHSKNCR